MSKKEELVKAFLDAGYLHPKEYYDAKDYAQFCAIINMDHTLRDLFNEAWKEAESVEDLNTVGLGLLFSDTR